MPIRLVDKTKKGHCKFNSPFDAQHGFLPFCPRKLISLWDMIRFFLHEFSIVHTLFEEQMRFYNKMGTSVYKASSIIPPAIIKLVALLSRLKRECEILELEKSTDKIYRLDNRIQHGVCSNQIVMVELEELSNIIACELDEKSLAYIPSDKIAYFECDGDKALFGLEVYKNFESARKEIKSAGNCLAADEHTAAVFHLMRVVEIGLRELARNLGLKKIKNNPLDYAMWKQVENEIDAKLEEKLPITKSAKKTRALQFKHDLLVDFKSFELKRNEIMHCRWSCNEQEAIGLFNRVREFMQRLAIQISPSPAQNRAKLKKAVNAIYERVEKEKKNENRNAV